MACADKPETPAEPAAPAAPIAAEAVVETAEVSATVVEIDHATREVTLMTEDGEEFFLVVDDVVENLAQVQQGDVVIATYTEALAYEVIPGGEEQVWKPPSQPGPPSSARCRRALSHGRPPWWSRSRRSTPSLPRSPSWARKATRARSG